MEIIAYTTIALQMPHRYQLQLKAPNGRWVTNMASDDGDQMLDHARFLQTNEGVEVRVVDMHA